jgi:thioredoxin reductase (NADPH)
MVTTSELRAIPLFAELADADLEYLARNIADIRLLPGEYAIHEGEERALLIAVEGRLDVVKVVEGVERVIGVRHPGDLFGEVPMMLNTPYLAGLRAVKPSRIVRIAPREFYTVCASAPEVSATVGAAALDRIEGLQEVAAQPRPPELLVVAARWDPASHQLRDFLSRNQVPFGWAMPEDASAAAVAAVADGKYPAVRLQDGTIVVQPSLRDVAAAVGLQIAPLHDEYDVVIVGGGPAGMASAVYGASEGLRTLLIERRAPGGQAGQSSHIENYLGFPVGVSGDELASRALRQAKRFGAEIVVTRSVDAIVPEPPSVVLDGGDVIRARAIILAAGVTYRRLTLEGAERLTGRGIFYGAARSEASSTQGQDIYLVGAGNSAGQAALFFANHAKSVTILCRADSLDKSMSQYLIDLLKTKSNIMVELSAEVGAVYGEEQLEAIDVVDRGTGSRSRRSTTGLFAFIGADTDTTWLPQEIARDERGFLLAGSDIVRAGRWVLDRDPYLVETSAPGVFAVGDIRAGSVKRVASGVGEGSIAIAFVHQFLRQT